MQNLNFSLKLKFLWCKVLDETLQILVLIVRNVSHLCCRLMLHHGTATCCVSTWLHADGAAFPLGGEGEMAVHYGAGDLVTNHPPSGTQTSHTGLWRPDGLFEHGQALVDTLALLT